MKPGGLRRALSAALRPLEFPVSAVLYLAGIRFLRLAAPGRIGHLVTDVATFVKQRLLGRMGRGKVFMISPPGTAANECLIDYWRRYVAIVRSPFWARVCYRFAWYPYLVHDAATVSLDETAPYIAIEREWGSRPPLLQLTAEHRRRGEAWLRAAGIPAGAQFVCFHSREPGYSPADDEMHAFRNSSIENYLPAVAELTRRGFWCIRMGHPSMRPIPAMEKVIDYAHHADRSDWLDVFLCAGCRFFLGSCSGLVNVAGVFGRPCAIANQAPLSHVHSFGLHDVCIPKLLWSEREQRYLSFAEILRSDAGNLRFMSQYRERSLRPVENTGEEVRDLALEMLERSGGLVSDSPGDEELQQRLRALMRPGHYAYGGINRAGREFLRKYEHLLGDRPA